MKSQIICDAPFMPDWGVPVTDSSTSTAELSNNQNLYSQPFGCSIFRRRITSSPDQYREWIAHVKNALDNIDVPFRDVMLQNLIKDARHDLDVMSQKCPGEDQSLYSHSLQQLIKYLFGLTTYPENISVLQTLADLGLGLEGESMDFKIRIPAQLLKQFLGNTRHETVLRILDKHAKSLMFKAEQDSVELLKIYLPHRQLQRAARELMDELKIGHHYPAELNKSLQFSDGSAPYLTKAIFSSFSGFIQTSQNFFQTIPTSLNSELFTLQLCMLELNVQRYEKLILNEFKKLSNKKQEHLLVCAFILGQAELFKRLLPNPSPSILQQKLEGGGNILHLMVTALPGMKKWVVCDYLFLTAYTPRYDLLFQYLPAEHLANQRDNSGATPLLLLYQHHRKQLASMHISAAKDMQLASAHRSALIKLTAPEHLIDCMQYHLNGNSPLNVSWFFEFIQLFRSLPPSTFKPVPLRSARYEYRSQLIFKPLSNAKQLLQPVINYFGHHPDVLRNEQQTLELIRLMQQKELPVEYTAQVLRVVPAVRQKNLLEQLSSTADDRDSLFVERCYEVGFKGFYPWHLIGLGVGGGCALEPDMFHSKSLLKAVAKFARTHPKETVPQIPGLWEAELINSPNIEVYGRSLAFPSTEVPEGYRRFKFLKRQYGATECWGDFIREQPHLDYFRTHNLGLESALLKPRGIYRLTNARTKLKACRLSDETLSTIAFETDGSALLQVFDDEKNTSLYHHYPYETQGVAGLSVQASFNGLRLFARDAGRLWQHNLQAPDTLSSFHNASQGRSWVPTPFFGCQTVPGTLGEWNGQDYPNIAPAPVGMRDWADIRSFTEQAFSSFGMDQLFATSQFERQSELRITELGKVFYGLIINWVRVRHDTDSLDYQDTEQMNQLQEELVTLAADLFGCAYKMKTEDMKAQIHQKFPPESRTRAALEIGYWCDPKCRYAQDIKSGRTPAEVYPDHPHQRFDREPIELSFNHITDRGIWRSSRAKGPNLGIHTGTLPLLHLDSLFWFCIYTGWRQHEPTGSCPD